MDASTILATVSLVVAMGGTILTVINHKRIRSHCCGADLVASIDMESTTPSTGMSKPAPAGLILTSVQVAQ